MKIFESECVLLKHRGAEYVSDMLLNKSKDEEFEFWKKRTKKLLMSNKKVTKKRIKIN